MDVIRKILISEAVFLLGLAAAILIGAFAWIGENSREAVESLLILTLVLTGAEIWIISRLGAFGRRRRR